MDLKDMPNSILDERLSGMGAALAASLPYLIERCKRDLTDSIMSCAVEEIESRKNIYNYLNTIEMMVKNLEN